MLLIDVRSGARIATIPTGDPPSELALSAQLGVVVARRFGVAGDRISWFNPRSGVAVGSLTADDKVEGIAVAGRDIVYQSGLKIMRIDTSTATPRPTVVATVASGTAIVGPVAAGTRVLWAENRSGRAQIRTLTLPT